MESGVLKFDFLGLKSLSFNSLQTGRSMESMIEEVGIENVGVSIPFKREGAWKVCVYLW